MVGETQSPGILVRSWNLRTAGAFGTGVVAGGGYAGGAYVMGMGLFAGVEAETETIVIGRMGEYEPLAQGLSARFFSWLPGTYDYAENMRLISEAAARGATFICSSSAYDAVRVFKDEVDLLLSKGYQISPDGLTMTPKY